MGATAEGWPSLWGFLKAPAGPLDPEASAGACQPIPLTTHSPSLSHHFSAGDGVCPSPPMPPHSSPLGRKRPPSTSPVDVRGTHASPLNKNTWTHVVSDVLDMSCEENVAAEANLPGWQEDISAFFSVSIPQLPTAAYVDRLVTYCKCSPTVLTVALVLLNRCAAADSRLAVSGYNLHRLLVTAVMLASKSVEDRTFTNAHFAVIGGVEGTAEMAKLERLMLHALQWRVQVDVGTISVYRARLEQNRRGLRSSIFSSTTS